MSNKIIFDQRSKQIIYTLSRQKKSERKIKLPES